MHPLIMMELADERLTRLRADAERARLLSDASRLNRQRRPHQARSLRVRLWRRQAANEPSKPVTSLPRLARFADLAERFAAHRPAAAERELGRFVDHARANGATPVLVSIVADTSQPDVARQRAFGRILVELGETRRTSSRSLSDIPGAA